MHDASPTARALLALELIQGSPGITADRLAQRLQVSGRAVRRYVGVLREAGIPVESLRGPYGGYRIGRGHRLPPLMFSTAEALGLVMAVLEGQHAAGDPDDPAGSALGKLIRVLPEQVAQPAAAVRSVPAGKTDAGATSPNPETTARLAQACAASQRIRLEYRLGPGYDRVMEVDPWAVVVRYGRWYLLCWSHTRQARRVFRIDRVLDVSTLAETFTPPADPDPVRTLEDHLSEGWKYPVEVIIDAAADRVGECLPRSLGHLEALDVGRCRLIATTDEPDWYAAQLAQIPANFHIVECRELQEAALELGRRLLAAGEHDR